MPTLATLQHNPQLVSHEPPHTSRGAADWCVLGNPEPKHLAPGGVVLCKRGTTQIHPEAIRYAREAWAVYGRYIAAVNPAVVDARVPAKVTVPGRTVIWQRDENRVPRHRAPGGWYLLDTTVKEHTHVYLRNDYYTEVEWARFAKTYVGTGADNLRARSGYCAPPVWSSPLPILTESDARGANKYTRRGITTKADRIAAEKIIKRPAVAGAA